MSECPESVALELLRHVAYCEGKSIARVEGMFGNPGPRPDREWVFSTYKACLDAVRTGGPMDMIPVYRSRLVPGDPDGAMILEGMGHQAAA